MGALGFVLIGTDEDLFSRGARCGVLAIFVEAGLLFPFVKGQPGSQGIWGVKERASDRRVSERRRFIIVNVGIPLIGGCNYPLRRCLD
jgi:hypothetical protein